MPTGLPCTDHNRPPVPKSKQDNTLICIVLFSHFRRGVFGDRTSILFFIQPLTECVEAGHLDRRTVQVFEALHVVNFRNAGSQRMRRREIESNLEYREDTLPEPLLNALFDPFFDPLFDPLFYTLFYTLFDPLLDPLLNALSGEVSGKG